jgi:cobalt-zinc-cadmium efflux system outer membrane protein
MRWILTLLLLVPLAATAESLEFGQAQKLALFNNPSLRAAYGAIGQARGRLLQAGLWPNPEIDLAYRSDVFFGGDGQDRVSASLMQRLPWSGRLGRAQAVSRVDVAVALTDVRDEERRIVQEVQRAYLEARSAAEKGESLARLIKSLDALVALNEARLKAGQASAITINLARVEREGLRQRMAALASDEGAAVAELKGLLGRPPDVKLTLTSSLAEASASLRRSTASRRLYRPDLVRASLEADAAAAEIALARAEAWEDITVGVEYEFERTLEDNELMNENFLGVRVAVPLPIWNRNQGRIAERAAAQERARKTVVARQVAIGAEIDAARIRAIKAASVADLIRRDALPLLEETRSVLENAIQTGQADTIEAITLTNQEIEQRTGQIEALTDEALALSAMEAALGANPFLNRDIFINTLHEKTPKKR